MIFNQYSRVEGDKGAGTRENWGRGPGENGGGEGGGSGIYLRAESESRNQKGTCLLFITACHPVKNRFPAKFFDFHLTSTEA